MVPISEDRADRLEAKVDALISAVNRLAVIDERQVHAGIRMGNLEDRVAKMEQKYDDLRTLVNQWVNRTLGMWALLVFLFTMYKSFGEKLFH